MLFRLGVLVALLGATGAAAANKVIKNDSFTGVGAVGTGVSFGEYQGAGVLFRPAAADYPLKIVAVDVFAVTVNGGPPGNYGSYVMSIWDESGGTLTPPTAFDGGGYTPRVDMQGVQFITSTTALQRFTLPQALVVDAGQVFVAVTQQTQTSFDFTTIALDTGPLVPGANWYFNGYGGYEPVDLPDGGRPFGIDQNWIIRLVLEVPDVAVTVDAITPSQGPTNEPTDVTITGTNFELGARAFVGTTELTLRSVTATTITATVPVGVAPGVYEVRVRNPNGVEGTLPNGYRVLLPDGGFGGGGGGGTGGGGGGGMGGGGGTGGGGGSGGGGVIPLTVASVTPSEMYGEDETTLVITGTGFLGGAQVLLGTTLIADADTVVKSSAVINVTVPAKTLAKGLYDVTVLNLDGERATLPMGLSVLAGSAAKAGCGCAQVDATALWALGVVVLALRRRRG